MDASKDSYFIVLPHFCDCFSLLKQQCLGHLSTETALCIGQVKSYLEQHQSQCSRCRVPLETNLGMNRQKCTSGVIFCVLLLFEYEWAWSEQHCTPIYCSCKFQVQLLIQWSVDQVLGFYSVNRGCMLSSPLVSTQISVSSSFFFQVTCVNHGHAFIFILKKYEPLVTLELFWCLDMFTEWELHLTFLGVCLCDKFWSNVPLWCFITIYHYNVDPVWWVESSTSDEQLLYGKLAFCGESHIRICRLTCQTQWYEYPEN